MAEGVSTGERFSMRRGLWFEEFEPGLVIESPARTITESDVVQFCGLSGDWTALHSDEETARRKGSFARNYMRGRR